MFRSNLALESIFGYCKGKKISDSGCNNATQHKVSQYGWKFAPRLAKLLLRVYTYFRLGARLPCVVTLFYSRVKKFPIANVITPLYMQYPRPDGNLRQGLPCYN
jgi:hypothetical protein